MTLISRIAMLNYPTKFQTTKGGVDKYYLEKDKLPAYLKKELDIGFEYQDGKLYNISEKQFVKREIKPKFVSIGGNRNHVANGSHSKKSTQVRAAFSGIIKTTLKEFFLAELKKVKKPIVNSYPIGIRFVFMGTKDQLNDLDGHDIYFRKTFLDIIQTSIFVGRGKKKINKLGFIDNDSVGEINMLQSIGILSEHKALIIEIHDLSNNKFKKIYEDYVEDYISNNK